MKSLNITRCPICYLIPKIFTLQFNEYLDLFVFKILCPNNHNQMIYNEELLSKIKFSLNEIPCRKCNIKNKSQHYCKECYAILCEKCKGDHIHNNNHKDIISINEIDNICLKHNEKFCLYCNNCNIEICKECINVKEHKGHEINNLNTITINELKTKVEQYQKHYGKNLEENKNEEIISYQEGKREYSSILEIEQEYKKYSNNVQIYIDFILDMINKYDLYIKYYNIPSYNLYLNLNLLCQGFDNPKIYCENYQKDLIRIDKNIYYDSYHHKRVFEEGSKLYCGLYKDENDDLIYVYYNLDKKTLYYFNLESWRFKKEVKLNLEEKIEIKHGFWCKAYSQLKIFKYKNIELILIYLENENTISIYNITDSNNYKRIFFRKFNNINDSCGKAYIKCINNKVQIIFFDSFEIYFYNLDNHLEMKFFLKEKINLKSIYFFEMKNLGKMLFISNNNNGMIYSLKSFKQYTKILIEEIKKVIIGDIYDKKCLIISCGSRGYIIYIIDFFSHEKIYQYTLSTTGYDYGLTSLFMLNSSKLFIIRIDDDLGNYYAMYSINLITDEEKRYDETFNKVSCYDYTSYELINIKLKNFGNCILERPEDLTWKNFIGLYYFNRNTNKDIIEYIKKISELERNPVFNYGGNFKEWFEIRISILKSKGCLASEILRQKAQKLYNNIDYIKGNELETLRVELYKLKKDNYKNFEIKLEELRKISDVEAMDKNIKDEEKKIKEIERQKDDKGDSIDDVYFGDLFE